MNVSAGKTRIECKGTFVRDSPVILTISHDEYDPQDLSATVTLVEPDTERGRNAEHELRADSAGNLTLQKQAAADQIVRLMNVHGLRVSGHNAYLDLEGYETGFSDEPIEGINRLVVQIELTPSGIVSGNIRKTMKYDGSIVCEEIHQERIELKMPGGQAQVAERHSYESVRVGDNRATLQIVRPRISYEVDEAPATSSADFKERVLEEASDVTLLLSLCHRQMVHWYKAEFMLIGAEGTGMSRSLIARRKRQPQVYPEHRQPSVSYLNLASGGLEGLIAAYRISNIRESLQRGIVFLVSSYADQTVAQKFFYVIASLEAVCDGYWQSDSDSPKIPSGAWGRIEKSIRAALDELDGMDMNHSGAIKQKLPELKRPSAVTKIKYCCDALAVPTDDLWMQEGFETGLGRALAARNHLFHRADEGDLFLLDDDCFRMQILVERFIFKSLGWPDDKLTLWYDWRLASLNGLS